MKNMLSQKPPPILTTAIIVIATIAIAASRVLNFDIWWHLKAGEVIWENGALLANDVFSYTAAGTPWLNHEWLFELVAWLAYNSWGNAALIAFKIATTAGIAFISYRTIKLLKHSEHAAMWGTLLLLWALSGRIMARPFMLTLFLVTLFCYLLHSFAAGKRRGLWATIPLTVIWVNWHGGGIIAPALVLAYALGESIQARLGGPQAIPTKDRRLLWLIGGLVLAASTLNPMGIGTFLFPFQHTDMNAIMAYTQEWLPVLDPRLNNIFAIIILKITVVAVMVSYIANRRDARISHIMLTLLTSYMLLKGHRFGPQFMIINIPILFFNFTVWTKKISVPTTKAITYQWLSLVAATVCSDIQHYSWVSPFDK